MKQSLFALVYLALLLPIFGISSSLGAQSTQSAINDLIRQTDNEVQRLENKNRKIGRIEFGRISADSAAFTFREMYRGQGEFGNEYEIIAFASEEELSDMDILLFEMVDGEPQLIKKNISKTAKAILTFRPSEKKVYVVTLRGSKFKTASKEAQFSLIIAYNTFN